MATWEGRAASGGEDEEELIAWIYHDTVLSGKLQKASHRTTDREGVGCLLTDDPFTKTGQPVEEVFRENRPDMCVPPMENPVCAAFEDYGEVPKTVPLDFTADDLMGVASKLSGAAGALGAEAVDLCNWLLCFGCSSEEFIVVVTSLVDWVAKSSPPWAAYRALMSCRLMEIDKRPGVRPVGIGEMLRQALAKLVMRAAGDQVKTACGNLQLCVGLEAGIEGDTHAVGRRRIDRVRVRRDVEEEAGDSKEKEDNGGVASCLNNLTIETAVAEEEAADNLKGALVMETEEEVGNDVEGEEGGDETQRALVALDFLTQDAEPSGTTLVDARNGFNNLIRLAMMWTVRHQWMVGGEVLVQLL